MTSYTRNQKNRTSVLIVDDSAYVRTRLSELLADQNDLGEIVTAIDGEDALKKVIKHNPDVIILDLEMPRMDGFTFLRLLLDRKPIPVIVLSAKGNYYNIIKAMELGAIDFIHKPMNGTTPELESVVKELREKIQLAKSFNPTSARTRFKDFWKPSSSSFSYESVFLPPEKTIIANEEAENLLIIAIGASTGGPAALYQIMSSIKLNENVAIVIGQHMPENFIQPFAERLDRVSSYIVKKGEHGEVVRGGTAYISPSSKNMVIAKKGKRVIIELKNISDSDRYVPSINKLFYSVAHIGKEKVMGIILTGMGDDGVEGLMEIKINNGYTVAESEETAVVFGMPREAIRKGAVDKVLPLREIPSEINNWIARIIRKYKIGG